MAVLRTLDLWTKSIFRKGLEEEYYREAAVPAETRRKELSDEEKEGTAAVDPGVEQVVGRAFGVLRRVLTRSSPDLLGRFADGLRGLREFRIGAGPYGWRFRGCT